MVLKLNSLSKSLSRKRSKGRQSDGKQQSGSGRHRDGNASSTNPSKNGEDRTSEIRVAAGAPEPTVTFRIVNGVRIALDPENQEEPFGNAQREAPHLGSPSRTESGGDPTGSDSDGVQELLVARTTGSRSVQTCRPVQTIVESGASVWEVRTLWLLKKCARYKDDVSMTVMRISASKALMGCLTLAIIGFVGFRVWQGPQRNVNVFLKSIGLEEYFPDFLEHRYIFLEDVMHITEEAELVKIGVGFKAERQRILRKAAALRAERSIALAVLWGLFCVGCASLVVLIGCVLVSPAARNRVACCLVWCGFMGWYKIRLWCRLWNTIDIECKPRLEWTPTPPPRTPDSTVNPPSEIYSAGSAPRDQTMPRGRG
ncbi:hypothetical protein BSKO_01590 [Bryopsis sp. KO-2023]|nr:hypothetical protein BSKO_01590 [Bryopsis sp. KO-2023]